MADARVLVRWSVQVAATALGAVLASPSAHAEEATGTASVSLGGTASATGSSTELAPTPSTPDIPAPEPPVPWRTKNPATYEFGFVTVGGEQSWSIIGTTLFFGVGGGLGPPLYRIGKLNTDTQVTWDHDLEIAHAMMFLRVSPIKYLDIDLGPKMALGASLFFSPSTPPTSPTGVATPQSSFSYGGYVDLRIGSPTIKVGPRFEYDRLAHSDFYEHGWRLTPIMVRVVH